MSSSDLMRSAGISLVETNKSMDDTKRVNHSLHIERKGEVYGY